MKRADRRQLAAAVLGRDPKGVSMQELQADLAEDDQKSEAYRQALGHVRNGATLASVLDRIRRAA